MAKFRILSFDGGGVYGVVSSVILRRIMEKVPDVIEKTDVIAGTSIGGFIALGIASGAAPDEIINEFHSASPKVFYKSLVRRTMYYMGLMSKYSNVPLKEFLQKMFGDVNISQLPKKVFVPTFCLDDTDYDGHRGWRAKFWHNWGDYGSYQDVPAWKLGLYTSAAPTLFPDYEGYLDGGICANNPSLAAVCQTQDGSNNLYPRPRIEDIVVLSIGQEVPKHYMPHKNRDRGYCSWAAPLVSIFLDTDNRVISLQCRTILNSRYIRISPYMTQRLLFGLDAADQINVLIQEAEKIDISPYIEQVSRHWCFD